jgi:hypothetical protein
MYNAPALSGRGAAGSAPGLGPGGREFESLRPDQVNWYHINHLTSKPLVTLTHVSHIELHNLLIKHACLYPQKF